MDYQSFNQDDTPRGSRKFIVLLTLMGSIIGYLGSALATKNVLAEDHLDLQRKQEIHEEFLRKSPNLDLSINDSKSQAKQVR